MEINNLLNLSSSVKSFKEGLDKGLLLCVSGVSSGEKAMLIHHAKKKCIIVCSDFVSMSEIKLQLSALGHKVGVISLGLASPIYSRSQDNSCMQEFITNLYDFYFNKIDTLIVLAEALFQKLPNKNCFEKFLNFEIKNKYSLSEVALKLLSMGYERKDYAVSKGEFAIRGDIVDIFPINSIVPVRLDFFGDYLENIYEFSLEDMVNLNNLKNILIYPATIFLLSDAEINDVKNNILNSVNNLDISANYFTKINNIVYECIEKLENYNLTLNNGFILPFTNFEDSVLSLFQSDLVFFDEPKKILNDLNLIYKNNQESIFNLVNKGELLTQHYNFFNNVEKCLSCHNYCIFSNFKNNFFNTEKTINFRTVGSRKYAFDFKSLLSDIELYLKNSQSVILFAGDKQAYDGISDFLTENKVAYKNKFSVYEQKSQVVVVENYLPLSASFLDCGIICIGTNDLIKKRKVQSKPQTQKKRNVFYLPKIGDYVVHEVHGVGKCIALERLNFNGSEKDYFVIEYLGGDKLYLPSEQANTISAFLGGDGQPKLNKIGGIEFARAKEKVRASVKELAVNLVLIYSEREKAKGFVYTKDNYLMDAFEDAFEYDETDDQLSAIDDIKKDMYSPKIMDRLICGDVGYGKTEVALRAAYQAVLDGKQVAFLCPTTILSEQHYNTTKARTKDFMVNVEVINRFRNKSQQTQILKELRDGKIDIICGTHRLLSNDVKFNNLGLLILDEEQRFGVADKEKIKELKKDIDVLTLTATPIPRTLNMAMTGIRDISIIETPPKNRLPIQTYVTEESDALIEDACKRELSRGGQVLVVYNRVEKIYEVFNKIKELVPYARVGVAHGQMQEKLLEDTIINLYNGEYDILVATTLIESGIDLPLANTLIVIDSDKLGLSALYQLRGRIGRSDRLAYAYFTFNPSKVLTQDAYKRLDAIMEFSELGSGFKIAMRDLEIRGAGNVLGKQQHGHMEKVGYDLYCRLLEEAVKELQGKKTAAVLPIKVDITCSAFIPDDFVVGEEERIKIYSQISEVSTLLEMEVLKREIENGFGDLPIAMQNLLKIALIKNMCTQIGAKRILIDSSQCKIFLYKTENIITKETAAAIEKYKDYAVLKFEDVPIIVFDVSRKQMQDKLDFIISFLSCSLNA